MTKIQVAFAIASLAIAAVGCSQNKPAADPSASTSGESSGASTAASAPVSDEPGAEWANAPDGETSTATKGSSLSPGNSMGTVDYGSGSGSNGAGKGSTTTASTPDDPNR